VAGFVKIPRDHAEAAQQQGAEAFYLWFDLWCRAAWRDQTVQTKQHGQIPVRRGQVIFSANASAKRLGIDRSKVRRCIERWERIGWITREPLPVPYPTNPSANLPSLLTLADYDICEADRDGSDQPSDQRATADRTTRDPERRKKAVKGRMKVNLNSERATKSKNAFIKTAPMSRGQFLYLASRIATWREEVGSLYVGEESYKSAFSREFQMTSEDWDQIRRQFTSETCDALSSEESSDGLTRLM